MTSALVVGDTAPDFDLATDSGRFRLSDHRGHGVLLFFYADDDTDGCTLENQEFSALVADFAKLDIVVAGVSPNSVADHCKFRDKYALTVPLIADPERIAVEGFGLWQQKKLYGREYVGLVRTTYLVGRDGKVAGVWRATRIKGHAAKVLEGCAGLLD